MGEPGEVWHSSVVDLRVVLGVLLGLVALWVAILVLLWVLRPRGTSLRALVGVVPDLLRLLRDLVGDRSTPLDVRVVIVILVAWIVSPIDLIPEFIPVLGPADDVVVAVVALRYVRRRVGFAALNERWPGSPEGFEILAQVIGR
jgi:uncharacterized membrane protein YkvA (DUF1232 family)